MAQIAAILSTHGITFGYADRSMCGLFFMSSQYFR